jgi:hypothetical protein
MDVYKSGQRLAKSQGNFNHHAREVQDHSRIKTYPGRRWLVQVGGWLLVRGEWVSGE